ncbi:HNH endonuclease [Nocardioides sp. BYT-33-1]|uniref:HNH endonuclease n=1 Tax=Nocardioides sp. BYT-33-1 TaxID=3416952 RepID=UPI003F5326E6
MSLPAYFWSKVEKTETCWNWTATANRGGYGRFGDTRAAARNGYGTTLAHRIAWQDVNGPVPDGLELDHLCNNPACVRPDHLEPVTHTENMRRRYERRETCPNGHPITPETRVPHYDVDHGDRCLPCRRKSNRESVRRQRARKIPAGQIVPWDVRVWAWANGYECGRKGQVPKRIVADYLAATAQERAA